MTDFLNDDVEGARPFDDDLELDRSPGLRPVVTFNPVAEGDPWSGTGNAAEFSGVGTWPTAERGSALDMERAD